MVGSKYAIMSSNNFIIVGLAASIMVVKAADILPLNVSSALIAACSDSPKDDASSVRPFTAGLMVSTRNWPILLNAGRIDCINKFLRVSKIVVESLIDCFIISWLLSALDVDLSKSCITVSKFLRSVTDILREPAMFLKAPGIVLRRLCALPVPNAFCNSLIVPGTSCCINNINIFNRRFYSAKSIKGLILFCH